MYTSDVLCEVHVYLCIIYIYIYIYIATMYVVFALICHNMPLNIQLTFPGPVLCDVH